MIRGRKRSLWLVVVVVLVALTPLSGKAAEPPGDGVLKVVYPLPADSARWDYPIGLLRLALEKSGRPFALEPTSQVLTQSRQIHSLEKGRVSVAWMGTSADFEARMRAVPVPLYRGLLGHRICIIDRDSQARFSAVRTLEDLKTLTMGQGLGWSDVDILEAAGFNVHTGRYETLFKMVDAGRIDCFPRGVNEAPGEVAQRSPESPGITVEKDVMLVYPFAMFFFVNRDDRDLAETLEKGLKAAYEDGSFMTYFEGHPSIRKIFSGARMEERRRFDIDNPLMTKETRAIPDRYWHGR